MPHPDDEVVACSAAIGRARAGGSSIYALYLTHGCIARELRWPWDRKKHERHVARRREEALQTARLLNLVPIGWPSRPARSLWQHLPALDADIGKAVADHNIDQIWTPAYEGGNADHDVVNALISRLAPAVSVLEFAEYNFAGGRGRSQEFPAANGSEVVITLTPEERELKKRALEIYRSERGNLFYVKTGRECFRPMAKYDYSRPPHDGTLWYARFQWVPFRHPRVDFTDPLDVCRAITRFMASQPVSS
ncbi:MAG TPA: PIG-L family deacetylase [Candidatus Binatia bacterium]|nr:PIG-L family deacetylase [Candidatus Binatia bacterium]